MPDSVETALSHDWWDPGEKYPRLRTWQDDGSILMSCRDCGVVRGRVSETRPCPGHVPVTLRGSPASLSGR